MYTDGTYLKNNPNWHSHESPWKAGEVVKAIKRNNLTISLKDARCVEPAHHDAEYV